MSKVFIVTQNCNMTPRTYFIIIKFCSKVYELDCDPITSWVGEMPVAVQVMIIMIRVVWTGDVDRRNSCIQWYL